MVETNLKGRHVVVYLKTGWKLFGILKDTDNNVAVVTLDNNGDEIVSWTRIDRIALDTKK